MPIPLGILAVAGAGGGGLANDYVRLETILLSSDTASVTFSNINTYTQYSELQIRGVARSSDGNTLRMRMNGDTAANYATHSLTGNGSSVSSSWTNGPTFMNVSLIANAGNAANIFGAFVTDILDHQMTSKNKTIRTLGGNSQAAGFNTTLGLYSGAWLNTAAITSITLLPSAGNLVSGSRFSLYGIK